MRQLQFGNFSAEVDDWRCHGLFRGHRPVGLSDAPREVLFALLQRRARPVAAKVLLNELWPAGANPSNLAALSWEIEELRGSAVAFEGEDFEPAASSALGAAGVRTFAFRGQIGGVSLVRLRLWSPWDGEASVRRRIDVPISVVDER